MDDWIAPLRCWSPSSAIAVFDWTAATTHHNVDDAVGLLMVSVKEFGTLSSECLFWCGFLVDESHGLTPIAV